MRNATRLVSLFGAAALFAVGCGGSETDVNEPTTLGQHATKPAEPAPVEKPEATEPEAEKQAAEPAEEKPAPEPTYTHGKFVWYEHWFRDDKQLERAKSFYEQLFGWTIAKQEMQGQTYWTISLGDMPIGLLAVPDKYKGKPTWMGYVSVPDVDKVFAAAGEGGAEPIGDPMQMEGIGRFAHFKGPAGAVFGVVKQEKGDMPDQKPQVGQPSWMELWVRGPRQKKQALDFYTGAVGYKEQSFPMGKNKAYTMLAWDDHPWAGVDRAPRRKYAGHWVPYIVVDDVNATVKKARKLKKLRARVVERPVDVDKVGRVAVLEDPTGALIGLIAPAMPEPADAAKDKE